MESKKHTKLVSSRFIKAMKQIIANELEGVTTQGEFIRRIGEYTQNVSKIEQGTRFPTIEVLVNLCLIFNVSPAWLFLGQGDMFGTNSMVIDGSILRRLDEIEKQLEIKKMNTLSRAS